MSTGGRGSSRETMRRGSPPSGERMQPPSPPTRQPLRRGSVIGAACRVAVGKWASVHLANCHLFSFAAKHSCVCCLLCAGTRHAAVSASPGADAPPTPPRPTAPAPDEREPRAGAAAREEHDPFSTFRRAASRAAAQARAAWSVGAHGVWHGRSWGSRAQPPSARWLARDGRPEKPGTYA